LHIHVLSRAVLQANHCSYYPPHSRSPGRGNRGRAQFVIFPVSVEGRLVPDRARGHSGARRLDAANEETTEIPGDLRDGREGGSVGDSLVVLEQGRNTNGMRDGMICRSCHYLQIARSRPVCASRPRRAARYTECGWTSRAGARARPRDSSRAKHARISAVACHGSVWVPSSATCPFQGAGRPLENGHHAVPERVEM
jgi:hypothetical protein